MLAFLIPIFIVIFITVFSTGGGNILKNLGDPFSYIRPYLFATKTLNQQEQKQSPSPSALSKPQTPAIPSFMLDTVIAAGPQEKESIADTRITFEFSGSINPLGTQGSISFESKIQGIDLDWVPSSKTRTLNLPAGSREYTLLARSKLNNVVDLTPASRTFRVNVSPSFEKVSISNVRATSSSSPFLITLSPRLNSGEMLSISNWILKSRSEEFKIGYGSERILSQGTRFQDKILIKSGDSISLSGAASPLGNGGNFRPNVCLGYLAQYYSSPLFASFSCPDRPTLQEVSFLAPACQDFILKQVNTSRCGTPSYSQIAEVATDSECVSYINANFNYDVCVARHSQDSTFLRNEWQIFVDRSFGNQSHDTIQLFDENGLLVSKTIY